MDSTAAHCLDPQIALSPLFTPSNHSSSIAQEMSLPCAGLWAAAVKAEPTRFLLSWHPAAIGWRLTVNKRMSGLSVRRATSAVKRGHGGGPPCLGQAASLRTTSCWPGGGQLEGHEGQGNRVGERPEAGRGTGTVRT